MAYIPPKVSLKMIAEEIDDLLNDDDRHKLKKLIKSKKNGQKQIRKS